MDLRGNWDSISIERERERGKYVKVRPRTFVWILERSWLENSDWWERKSGVETIVGSASKGQGWFWVRDIWSSKLEQGI